ncbi:MAG: DnaJ domain-containing protein [Magnetococcales bacterium]|nr:DnaJ domain-containing protein [Magnetococcales bacterium]
MSSHSEIPAGGTPAEAGISISARLLEILLAHPGGMREHALVKLLQRQGVAPFATCDLSEDLSLFRTHFFLFHQLYLLQGQLRRERQGDLRIHCLEIVLKPWREGGEGLECHDPLRSYYLDTTHLESTTREEVIGMIAGFWRQLGAWERQESARVVLGVAADADRVAIRRRYRELSLLHHPDRGGDAARFRVIAEAAEALLKGE